MKNEEISLENRCKTRGKVLVIDDEEDKLELASIALRRAGYEPITAQNEEEAFYLLANHNVKYIVTDFRLEEYLASRSKPESERKSSEKFCKYVKKHKPEIPVIMVTATDRSEKNLAHKQFLKGPNFSYNEVSMYIKELQKN